MLDRYLVSAEAAGIPAQIVISKLDLMEQLPVDEQAELEAALADYRRIGYAVYKVSAYQQRGLEELHTLLQGRTSALLGKSGVGKTSLLNAVQPGLGQRVERGERLHWQRPAYHHASGTLSAFGRRRFAGYTRRARVLACGVWRMKTWPGTFRKCAPTWDNAGLVRTAVMPTNQAARCARRL